jgi:predicted enzyme related to lactoylglutathione lyase
VVTRDTPWLAGTPCWVEVTVADVPKAAAFYRALFGWDIESGGDETGGYRVCRKNGRIVAGLSPELGASDALPSWTTYLAADDADAVAARIRAAGGQLLVEPTDVRDTGRMALAVDTAGAGFGLWQGGTTTGIGLANEPGSLSWNEHMSRDYDASKGFYRAVFGYDYQDVSEGGFRYAMLMVDGREVGGIGQYEDGTPEGAPATWSVYFAVDDTDAAVARVSELGGSVVEPVRDSPFGRIGVVNDDQGAVFSVITTPTPPELQLPQ